MSTAIRTITAALVPPSQDALDKIQIIHETILQFEQIPITTAHLIHGGMYARSIRLEPETRMVGSLIKLPTLLIVNGDTAILVGDTLIELSGYNVIPGCAGRKQVFITHGTVEMTMIFATSAKTVEDAENEVFAEAELLMSRNDSSRDIFTITGE